jgi:signal transduction histidine kinase
VNCAISCVGDNWEVKIADQGYGIAEEDLPKLFNRFSRLKHDDQPAAEGIGLGLVFVKTVVVSHRGDMRVESRVYSPGASVDEHGTTFVLSVPVVKAP